MIFLALLPFFTLVRVSVFLAYRYELGSWLALGGGGLQPFRPPIHLRRERKDPGDPGHLPQEDGYVHAVDIRTLGRPEWRNRAVALYFQVMGFGTLRHSGTADHLHVALILPSSRLPP